VVQSANGELGLCSADVKDAHLMVEQDEKVFLTTSDGTNYILGRCLPGQRGGSKSWYDLLALVLKRGKPVALLQAKIKENDTGD
jgi:hypothetical protein